MPTCRRQSRTHGAEFCEYPYPETLAHTGHRLALISDWNNRTDCPIIGPDYEGYRLIGQALLKTPSLSRFRLMKFLVAIYCSVGGMMPPVRCEWIQPVNVQLWLFASCCVASGHKSTNPVNHLAH